MKILHILDHSIPLHSGYTFRTRAILEQQRKLGWKTFHVTSAKHKVSKQEVEEIDGLKFYRTHDKLNFISNVPILNQLGVVMSLNDRLNEIIPEVNPDIIHAHSPALNGLAALKAGKKFNIPVVYECRAFWEDAAVDHGTTSEGSLRYKFTKALETFVFKRADAITCICKGLKTDIISRGLKKEKITVIPNAVDISKFTFGESSDSELEKKLSLEGKIVLGFIGSFYAYEGIPLILDALPEIIKQKNDIRFLLVGGGPQEHVIKEKVKELNLQDYVIFTGRVDHDEVKNYYNLVDVFLYPRLSMRLTDLVTPLKPLEAMAQGRLVVASDVGGHRELIKDRKNGLLFKANNAGSLTKTVIELLENPETWGDIKQAGKVYIEKERNWQKSVENYYQVYQSIKD